MNIDPAYTYLLLNIGTLIFPLILSFDRKVAFFKHWKALFPAIALTGAVFITWDVAFTEAGIWGFNPDYLVGWYLFGLPIEEWLFFLTVPYACVFIYSCVLAYIGPDLLKNAARPLAIFLAVLLLVVGLIYLDRSYTSITFLSTAALLGGLVIFEVKFLGRFFVAYLISSIPFFLVNGVLTALPVVWYNDLENLGIRLGTVPVEDSMYSLLLLLMNVSFYEYFKHHSKRELAPAGN